MKFVLSFMMSVFSFATLANAEQCSESSAGLEGPYLGQSRPGSIAKIFAPGIVSAKQRDLSGFFTPDMKEFYFTRMDKQSEKWTLEAFIQNDNNSWCGITVGPRIGRPTISPDGKTMHLGKSYMERTSAAWSEVKSLGPMFDRKDWGIMRLSSSKDGTYVLDDYKNGDVIRISTLKNGQRQSPTLMSPKINSGKYTAHPFIAPDGSWLIWDSEREGGYGDSDLYISFKQQDGTWGDAINLGDQVNTSTWEAGAYVTPDGKYLFFNRNEDIYWVDASFIQDLKPRK